MTIISDNMLQQYFVKVVPDDVGKLADFCNMHNLPKALAVIPTHQNQIYCFAVGMTPNDVTALKISLPVSILNINYVN